MKAGCFGVFNSKGNRVIYLLSSSFFFFRCDFSLSLAPWKSQHGNLHGDISRGWRWSDGAPQCQGKRERGGRLSGVSRVWTGPVFLHRARGRSQRDSGGSGPCCCQDRWGRLCSQVLCWSIFYFLYYISMPILPFVHFRLAFINLLHMICQGGPVLCDLPTYWFHLSDTYQDKNALMGWRVYDVLPLTPAVVQIRKQQEHTLH